MGNRRYIRPENKAKVREWDGGQKLTLRDYSTILARLGYRAEYKPYLGVFVQGLILTTTRDCQWFIGRHWQKGVGA